MAVLSKPMLALLSTLALMAIVRRFGAAAVRHARRSSALVPSTADEKARGDKVGVSPTFLLELLRLLRICVPSVLSPEAGIAALVAALMVARTAADIFMIDVQTRIEASIISRDATAFSSHLGRFIGAFLPVALINNVMKYAVKELQMRMRTRLTRHLVDKYMSGTVYAQVAAIDSRLANADQLIVQDVERFTTSVADLFTNVTKPSLDIALYCYRLGSTVGWGGPALMAAYLTLSGGILTWLRAPSAQLTASEQRLEGQYRHVHSRVIAHAEEIAFLQGGARERAGILRAFDALVGHVRTSQRFRYLVGTVDTMLAKYAATVVGFYVVSRPFLAAGSAGVGELRSDRSLVEQYYSSGRQLLNLATAIGRLVLAGRDMARLAGFTQRITTLTAVLDDLQSGFYVRTMVAGAAAAGAPEAAALAIEDGPPAAAAAATGALALSSPSPPPAAAPERRPLMSPAAVLVEVEGGDVISFAGVPLRTPNGDVLLRSLDLEVRAGMNTLIAGPNGCGKSSFFRVLRGLWPQFGGRIERPPLSQLLYIPQRPYLTLGSLRDQVTYPLSAAEAAAAGRSEADVAAVLQAAHLQPILARVGGLDAILDWADVLSGGEKQRVGFARLLFHRPRFAILDECSSAVSVDVEGALYERCRELGITLFSVSHRRSLWRHHEFLLRFDGQGGYEFRRMTPEDVGEGAWGS